MPSDQPAIRCSGVTKSFGVGNAAVKALRGVDLEVRLGELLMLVGPSGCGKTTLISVLSGLMLRDDGECMVLDRDYRDMTRNELTRFRGKNLGFVFQSFDLIPTLTAAENACIPLLIHGLGRKAALKRTHEVLSTFEFDARMMRALPKELSGGQQQRVAIARAIVHDPKLIVCDEPTSALDSRTGSAVMRHLRDSALDTGRMLVVVTHDARIFDYADRIAWMEDGRMRKA